MLAIVNRTKNIYFNLATEEYLLRRKDVDIFMLWESEASVVIGKHQNAMAEVNYSYLKTEHIPVARRLSGGGTVYHGPGNLNFSFIRNGQPGRLVDFVSFVRPVVSYLQSLGVEAEIGKRNDLLVAGKKVSGNAEHVYRQRVLHHGTLLFSADLERLRNSLQVIPGRFRGKAVASARSEVANLSSFLSNPMTFDEFREGLFNFLMKEFPGAEPYTLQESEVAEINLLIDNRYSRPEWIYGYSPDFEVRAILETDVGEVELSCQVSRGIITSCRISPEIVMLKGPPEKGLTGTPFSYEEVQGRLVQLGSIDSRLRDAVLKALFP